MFLVHANFPTLYRLIASPLSSPPAVAPTASVNEPEPHSRENSALANTPNTSSPAETNETSISQPEAVAAPSPPQQFLLSADSILREEGNVTLLPNTISIDGGGTKITFIADGTNSAGGRVCEIWPDHDDGQWLFLIDDHGKRYKLLKDDNTYPGSNCIDFHGNERMTLTYIFEPIDSGVHNLTLHWEGPNVLARNLSQQIRLSWQDQPLVSGASNNSNLLYTRLQISGSGVSILSRSGVGVIVDAIDTNNYETKVYFRATNTGSRNASVCSALWDGLNGFQPHFIIDDKGNRYNLIFDLRGRTCPQLAQGETTRIAMIYQRLNLPINSLSIHWTDGISPSVIIPIEVSR